MTLKFHRKTVLACALSTCLWLQGGHLHSQTPPEAPLPPSLAGLPSLGSAGDDAVSSAEERQLGSILWREVRSDADFISDPYLDAYLNRLLKRLLISFEVQARTGFRVFALADNQLNAFAMPGKLLGIHSGLMLGVQREGELAAVLAHEIGHVTQRHYARRVADEKSNAWIGWAGMAAAILAARSNSSGSGNAMQGAVLSTQALMASKQLGFSRDMEREADAVGLQLLRDAQFDGGDMVRMLRKLAAASGHLETSNGYARSHPGTTERMANVEGRLRRAGTPPADTEFNVDFLMAQARLRAVKARSGDDRAQALFVFEEAVSAGAASPADPFKGLQAQTALYGMAVMHLEKNPSLATQIAEKIKLEHPWTLALRASLGTLDAAKRAELSNPERLKSHPELAFAMADDVLLSVQKNRSDMNLSGDLSAAIAALNAQIATKPHDDMAWSRLAQLYDKDSNRPLRAAWVQFSQAQSFAAQNAYPASLGLLDKAIRSANQAGLLELQTAWVQRERELKNALDQERAFSQNKK